MNYMQESRPDKPQSSGPAHANSSQEIAPSLPATFEVAYENYGALVRGVCRRILRDASETEDAIQDVFLHIFRKIHTFRGDAAFSTWLYRLTTNVALMRLRANKLKTSPIAEDDWSDVVDKSIVNAELNSRQLLDRLDLVSAIGSLPANYRSTYILHDIQGYRHKEIAAILGYSVTQSKCQLHRARGKLRQRLQGVPLKGDHPLAVEKTKRPIAGSRMPQVPQS